jgi:hypothetical protein
MRSSDRGLSRIPGANLLKSRGLEDRACMCAGWASTMWSLTKSRLASMSQAKAATACSSDYGSSPTCISREQIDVLGPVFDHVHGRISGVRCRGDANSSWHDRRQPSAVAQTRLVIKIRLSRERTSRLDIGYMVPSIDAGQSAWAVSALPSLRPANGSFRPNKTDRKFGWLSG